MLKEIYLIDLVQQSGLFISKDAGHMVLLMLHIESIRQNSRFCCSPRRKSPSHAPSHARTSIAFCRRRKNRAC